MPARFRLGTFIVASLIGLILAGGELFDPFDEVAYSAQAVALRRPASGQVVAIEVREEDKLAGGGWPWNYYRWAALVERLTEFRPRRVLIDFFMTRPRPPVEEAAFEKALAAAPNRFVFVTVISTPKTSKALGRPVGISPVRPFIAKHAQIADANFSYHAVGNDLRELDYGLPFDGKRYPTVAPALLDLAGPPGAKFVLDKSIDLNSIKRFNYEELMSGRVPTNEITGKYVLLIDGGSNQDLHPFIGYGSVHGGLLHGLAIETLLRGAPRQIPPIYSFVALFLLFFSFRKRRIVFAPWPIYLAGILAIVLLSFGLLRLGLILPVVSTIALWSLFCWVEAWTRMRSRMRTEGGLTNLESGLPNLLALERLPPDPDVAVIAVLLPGLDPRLLSSSDQVALRSYAEAIAPNASTTVYDGGNGQLLLAHALEGSGLSGYAWRVSRAVSHVGSGRGDAEHSPHLGIDLNRNDSMSSRAASALELSRDAKAELIMLRSAVRSPAVRDGGLPGAPAAAGGEVRYRLQSSPRSGEFVGATAWPIEGSRVEFVRSHLIGRDREAAFNAFSRMWTNALAVRAELLDQPDSFTMMVPLPALALINSHLLETVRGSLRMVGVSAQAMAVCVDVPDLIEAGARGVAALIELRAHGLSVGLARYDQHSRGLDYLRMLPSSILVANEQFADLMIGENRALMRSTIDLSRQLGRELLVSGVNNIQSLRMLAQLDVDRCEGSVTGGFRSTEALLTVLRMPGLSTDHPNVN